MCVCVCVGGGGTGITLSACLSVRPSVGDMVFPERNSGLL